MNKFSGGCDINLMDKPTGVSKHPNLFKRATIGVISFWLVLFVFLPNIMVFVVSFMTRDEVRFVSAEFTTANYITLLNPLYLKVLISSGLMALITTILCVILAFPFSYILSRMGGNKKNTLLMLIIVPFWTSALIRTYAIKIILTTYGLLNSTLLKLGLIAEPLQLLYEPGTVVLGLVYTLLPFMILPMYAAMEKLDYRYIEAAHDLGASKLQTMVKVVIPLVMPGVIAGSLLVFLPALGLFYIPDILGGSKGLLIGNLMQNQFMVSRNWPFGSALSVMLMLVIAILLLANYRTAKELGKSEI